jgi:hypothetical protein
MVVHGFGFGMCLVWIIGSSLLANSFVLCGATIVVLYGTTTVVICGIHHPGYLFVYLIGLVCG